MASELSLYTSDKQWKVELWAFKKKWLVYNSLGSEVTAYQWGKKKKKLFLFGGGMGWVERKIASISIQNTYYRVYSSTLNHVVGTKSTYEQNISSLTLKEWSAGTIKLEMGGGMPEPGLGAAPALQVDAVIAEINVTIGGESLSGAVEKGL